MQVYVSQKDDRVNGGGYRLLAAVMSDEERRKMLLKDASSDFKVWQRKYQHLRELVPVFEAMEKVGSDLAPVTVALPEMSEAVV